MKQQILLPTCLFLFAVNMAGAQDELPSPPEATLVEGEPLLRGPIHEAYAEPLEAEEIDPLVSPVEPPEAIEEVPPEAKPAGERVAWIPGYWAWDDDRQDYIWISGVWRQTPPGRSWVAGEWVAVDGGYQWSPGYWAADEALAVERVPAPPPSLDHGPVSPAPSDDHFWIPGCWQYRAQRYAWRPGYWSPCHDDWVWVPDHYVYGPAGCVYVRGYWDYAWESRGVLYSPCYFDRRLVSRPGYYYRPSVVVDVSGAFFHLWVRPNYCHYYFGDYYDRGYGGVGFLPWHQYHYHRGHGYDPLFVHSRWRFRRDRVDLYRHLENRHRHLALQSHARPARHLASRQGGAVRSDHDHDVLARHLNDHVTDGRARRQQIRENVLRAHRDQLREGLADNQVPADTDREIGNRQRPFRGTQSPSASPAGDRNLATRSRQNRTHNPRGSEFAANQIQRRANVEPTDDLDKGVASRRNRGNANQEVRPIPGSRDRVRNLASSSSSNAADTGKDSVKNDARALTEAEARNAIRRQLLQRNRATLTPSRQRSVASDESSAAEPTRSRSQSRANRGSVSTNTRTNVQAEARTNSATNTRSNVRTRPRTNTPSPAASENPRNEVRRSANAQPVPQAQPRTQTQRREEVRARVNSSRRSFNPRASTSAVPPTLGRSSSPRSVAGSTSPPSSAVRQGVNARTVSKPAVQLPSRQLPTARTPTARTPSARPPNATRAPAARTPARQVNPFQARRSSTPAVAPRRAAPSAGQATNASRRAVSGSLNRRSINATPRGGGRKR